MKSTIKLNNKNVPKSLRRFLPSTFDLRDLLTLGNISRREFSNYMLSVYNGKKIFKSTGPSRHKLSNEVFLKTINEINSAVIIDAGASDGSTSLDLIEKAKDKFSKYFVTDLSFHLNTLKINGNTYFYDPFSRDCLILVNDYFILFKDEKSIFNPIKIFANHLISKSPAFDLKKNNECNLCQPDLLELSQKDSRIIIKKWNIFEKWNDEKADFIKAANVLNKGFFSDEQISKAVKNFKMALKEGGYLLIVENRNVEKFDLLQLSRNKFRISQSSVPGTEIVDLILSV